MKEFMTIGQIINVFGVKGELKIYPLTDDIKRFRKLERVYVDNVEKKIVWCKFLNDLVVLKIEGIDTMEEGMKYKDRYMEIPRAEAVKLSEGEYFITDIIGCTVIDENGFIFGPISDVIQTGSNDVYWVKGKNEILIPALKSVVVSMDMDKREIIIKPKESWQ
jgi:16S rRNA processing protein RimM